MAAYLRHTRPESRRPMMSGADISTRVRRLDCSWRGSFAEEVQIGRPVDDRDIKDLPALAPTYVGLERVIR